MRVHTRHLRSVWQAHHAQCPPPGVISRLSASPLRKTAGDTLSSRAGLQVTVWHGSSRLGRSLNAPGSRAAVKRVQSCAPPPFAGCVRLEGHTLSLRPRFLGCKKPCRIVATPLCDSRGRHSQCTLSRWRSLKLCGTLSMQPYMAALHEVKTLAWNRYAKCNSYYYHCDS